MMSNMNNSLNLEKQFNVLVKKCADSLLESQEPQIIEYIGHSPKQMKESRNVESNKLVLGSIKENGSNIYAIWSKKKSGSRWKLKYVGQRSRLAIKQRLREHLFWKNKQTGSQLENVRKEIKGKHIIGITTIDVYPDELRSSLEERLIRTVPDNKELWNIKAK